MDDQTFARVGDYEILGVLGAGGMGKVYKVRNVISDRVEAMKVLLPDLADRRALADRFLREIKLLATLNHPNIAALRTALTWENQLVMIMEYVEGVTLSALLRRGAIAPAQVIDYMGQVLSALGYAHSLHIIHRDIKPANMMLTQQGIVKLMDFGIARSQGDPVLTQSGSTLGSLQYMSPEQVRGEQADERSDLYSLGVSLYEMVVGQRPFRADNEYAVMLAHLQTPPPPPISLRPELPQALNDIILMAMAKDPAERFQSATAMRNALLSVAAASDASAAIQPVSPLPDAPLPPLAGNRADDATGTCASPPSDVVRAAAHGSGGRTAFSEAVPQVPVAEPTPPAASARVPVSIPPTAPSAKQNAVPLSAGAGVSEIPPTAPSQPQPQNLPPWQAGSVAPKIEQQPSPVLVPPNRESHPLPAGAPPNRGLYIALGSVIVLVILVAAGLYIPRMNRAHAGGDANNSARPTQTATPPTLPNTPEKPSAAPAPEQSGTPSDFNTNRSGEVGRAFNSNESSQWTRAVDNSAATSVDANRLGPANASGGGSADALTRRAMPRMKARPSKVVGEKHEQTERSAMNTPSLPAASAPPSQPDNTLEELEHDADLLAGRAEAVDGSLETLRQSQSAQGLGLRGDVVASRQRMRMYINGAQMALRNGHPQRAKMFLNLADTEVTNLEKFLGR